jgi:phosphate:Na+ symporter
MNEKYIELKSDLLLLTRGLAIETSEYFEDIATNLHKEDAHPQQSTIKARVKTLQQEIDSANRTLLSLMADPQRKDAGALINFITYSQRLKDKLTNFANLSLIYEPIDETQKKP